MKRSRLSKQKHKMYRLRKGVSESRIQINPWFKEINRLRNRIKGVVTVGQDPIQLNFQLVKGIKEKLRGRCGGAHL